MWNTKKSVRFSLILTYIFLCLLVVGIIGLPFFVEWYVRIRERSPYLPATIMITCYPCVPFAATILWSLRKVLLNIEKEHTVCLANCLLLRRISWWCFAIMAMMLFSGHRYLPFYVCAICAAFIGLILRVVEDIMSSHIAKNINDAKDTAPKETEVCTSSDKN